MKQEVESPGHIRMKPSNRSGYNNDMKDCENFTMFTDNVNETSPMTYTEKQVREVVENKRLKFLSKLTQFSEQFREEILECSDYKLEEYNVTIRSLINDWSTMSRVMQRMKRLIYAGQEISKNLYLQEAMYKIVDMVCDVLDCDRASVFMLDELNGQLWTKAAVGADTIRIPMTQGIVGRVVTEDMTMNIEDAYQCDLFNK